MQLAVDPESAILLVAVFVCHKHKKKNYFPLLFTAFPPLSQNKDDINDAFLKVIRL